MPWTRYFEPSQVVTLMSKDRVRFWLFGVNIVFYYMLQIAACISITNFYGDTDRFLSCQMDNYRKPLDAAAVFDKPLLILAIFHIIEWIRTTVLLAAICMGSDLAWLMWPWYLTIFNTLFGLGATVNAMYVLGTEEGQACAKYQVYRGEWLKVEVISFWILLIIYSLPMISLRFCSKESHDEILAGSDSDDDGSDDD